MEHSIVRLVKTIASFQILHSAKELVKVVAATKDQPQKERDGILQDSFGSAARIFKLDSNVPQSRA
jgi:hypothetical protein